MFHTSITEIALLSVIAFSIAATSIWVISYLDKRRVPVSELSVKRPSVDPVFLFRAGILVDATPEALLLFPKRGASQLEWHDIATITGLRVKGVPTSQIAVAAPSVKVFQAINQNDIATITIEQWEDMARISLHNWSVSQKNPPAPQQVVSEVTLDDVPNPIWKIDANGELSWGNRAYTTLAHKLLTDIESDTLPILFDIPEGVEDKKTRRLGVMDETKNHTFWYDVVKVTSDHATMFYAIDANAIVNAEMAQRNFVQTLTKTFAQLSIGLAIFDRDRQLALFNPALIDLTALPADFLSARPNLLSFFDRMRENRMIPEPKNYSTWRERIAELVVAAADGRYSETWTLPSGLTYRVSGRPHPDGAIAFLFEDISAEISLTRRFRSDLETSQSVMDALEQAVIAFSSAGTVTYSNAAYRNLWKTDPDKSFAEYTTRDALTHWKANSLPSDIWTHLRKILLDMNARKVWSSVFNLEPGRSITVHVRPMGGGATVVTFENTNQKQQTSLPSNPTIDMESSVI